MNTSKVSSHKRPSNGIQSWAISYSHILIHSQGVGPATDHCCLCEVFQPVTSSPLPYSTGWFFMNVHFGRYCDNCLLWRLQRGRHQVNLWPIWSKVPGTWQMYNNYLMQGAANLFCEGLDRKYYRPAGHVALVTTTQLFCHRQCMNSKWCPIWSTGQTLPHPSSIKWINLQIIVFYINE